MDFQFLVSSWSSFSLLLTLFFPILMATVILIVKMRNTRSDTSRLPPGPTKLPIIGNLHNLVGDLITHRLQHLAEKHGPLVHLKLGEISMVVVSSSDLAMEFLKIHDLTFSSRPTTFTTKSLSYNCTDVAFSPYGEYWRQVKKICILELLSVKKVKSISRLRQEEVGNMIKSISKAADDSTPVNLSEMFSLMANNIISRAAFGEKCKNQEQIIVALKKGFELVSGFNIGDLFPSLESVAAVVTGLNWRVGRVVKELDCFFDEIIEEHLKKRREGKKIEEKEDDDDDDDDFVDTLLRIKEEDGLSFTLTYNNIKAIILDMFGGGTETSATTLEWIMSELMRNSEIMKKAKSEVREVCSGKCLKVDETSISEMNYINLIIKENFRLHPPLPLLIPRECREDCEVKGYKIPKKTQVMVNMWTIGRDPEKWEEPEKFKPERFIDSPLDFKGTDFEFIPFGAGRRICPGLNFGVSLVELVLSELLLHFDWKTPNASEELDMSASVGVTMGRKTPLVLVPLHALKNLPAST